MRLFCGKHQESASVHRHWNQSVSSLIRNFKQQLEVFLMTKKRIFTVLLVVTMCVSMALPTFAASWTTPGGIYSNISGTSSTYLNLEGEGKAYNHRNVTRASASTSLDQDWYIRISSIDDGYKVYSSQRDASGNVGYMLNLYRSDFHCDIFRETNADPDSDDSIVTRAGTLNSFKVYTTYWGSEYCLTARSNTRQLYWGGSGSVQWTKE